MKYRNEYLVSIVCVSSLQFMDTPWHLKRHQEVTTAVDRCTNSAINYLLRQSATQRDRLRKSINVRDKKIQQITRCSVW